MDIQDRIVVITGAGSGIGEALAKAFAQSGARHVVATDMNEGEAERVATEIEDHGGSASSAHLDVADESQLRALVDRVEDTIGPVDVFVSNAGYVTVAGLEDSNASIERMWEVHVMAHIYAARAVVPSMAARGEGYLLNTASAAGVLSQIGSLAYTITKHAAGSLAEWLAITHHHQGIRVSVLCPQAVRTNIVSNSPDEALSSGSLDDFGVAAADGIVEAGDVARMCIDAMAEERFHVLPHPEVADYIKMKATDADRWLAAMRKFQHRLFGDAPLPGDSLISR
ncbi:MAG: SDR family oxidoreductase [Acidimicrobiales bacterium]|nr:SDR family oxidoreductase [Acidimicrobiales bacterium]